ncbi:MAG TPA: TolC family protein [Ignavibacteriaceae bacterium]|nr:TolC family protein [Ignavibacteriaceae bacterium]
MIYVSGSGIPYKIKKLILPVVFILFGFSLVLKAQSNVNPDSALYQILNELEGEKLSLSGAVQSALTNATSVRIAEGSLKSASGTLRRERGVFDPSFYFNLNYEDFDQPSASFFAGAPVLSTQRTTASTGLRLNLPTGTQLELALNSVKLKTNSAFAFLNPEYDAFGSLSLRQPLLKGFTASSRKQLSKAESDYESAKNQYDQAALMVSTDVERLYWDLYAAERDYAVQKLVLDRAEAFLKEAQLRAQAGLVGPNQVANARTFLAEQELLWIDRREQLDNLSDELAALIGKRPSGDFARFVVVDEPPENIPVEPVDDLIDEALNNNLDLRAFKNNLEAARTLLDAAVWEALPSVDLVGSLSGNGLSGTPRDVILLGDTLRSTTSGNLSQSLSQVFRRDYPGWSLGVEINIPIGLRQGLGESDRLEGEVTIAEQRYVELSRLIEEQIRSTYRELTHGKERLKAALEGVQAAQEQVRIGLIEFKNGRLTAFELVRLSEDYAIAQGRYSDALVRTAKSAATLKQLTSGKYPSA